MFNTSARVRYRIIIYYYVEQRYYDESDENGLVMTDDIIITLYIILYRRTGDDDYENKLCAFYNANTHMRACRKKRSYIKRVFFLVFVYSPP